jgi:hypothetical protein
MPAEVRSWHIASGRHVAIAVAFGATADIGPERPNDVNDPKADIGQDLALN